MKDEFQPLEPVGHEATEARIVAWVHGEVSAEEAAELEALCVVRPDLERFRREIADVHRLLGEASSESGWTLSAERRARLDAAFAGRSVAAVSHARKASGRWVRPVLLAAAACVVLAAGFHFIVGPVGDTRLAVDSRPLPSIMTLPKESKSPADFRREANAAQAGRTRDASDHWVTPAAPAALSPLEASRGEVLADSALRTDEIQPFAAQVPQTASAEPAGKMEAFAETASAGMPAEVAAMVAPLKRKDESPARVVLSEREARIAEINRAFEAAPVFQRDEWLRGTGSGRASASWRFVRLHNDARSEEFEVRISTAKEARDYKLASGATVKLLVEDHQGVECSQKPVTVGGKTMTIEAMLREALEGK